MPLISVILPTYNSAHFLAEAVQSILDQTFSDFELIVINDASTDDTLQVLSQFQDDRLRVVTNETNLRVVKSLNKGLLLAKGELVARMDADDISHPDRLKEQVDYLNKHQDVDLCATWVHKFGKRSFTVTPALKHEDIKASLLFHNIIIHPSVMFRKATFDKHQLRYEESYVNAEDYGLWAEAIDKIRFGIIPKVLLNYRIHDDNVSVHKESNWAVIKEVNTRVFKIFFERLGIRYSSEQLNMHLFVGFKLIKVLNKVQFEDYLQWLTAILKANKRSRYFSQSSLADEIILQILFVATRKEDRSRGAYYDIILKTLIKNGILSKFIFHRLKFVFKSFFQKEKKEGANEFIPQEAILNLSPSKATA